MTVNGQPWSAPVADRPLNAVVELPGSKSLTNRALVLAALSKGPSRITGGLQARDTRLMITALAALGVGIETADDGGWLVTPGPLHGTTIDCGLAGTVMRFVPPVAALAQGVSSFDGDPHARTRPMRTLLDGLRQAGVVIDDDGRGKLPFDLHGRAGAVSGGRVQIDASASSQYVSGLLLAGARFEQGIDIQHDGPPVPSQPHIDMTVLALRAAGVVVDVDRPNRWAVAPGPITAPDTVIEPDLSNAAPFLAAALAVGGSVTVARWPSDTSQAGGRLPELLAEMGADVRLGPDGLTVTGTHRPGPLVADLHEVGELTPVLAALCALADGESRLTGIAHLRGHETDRLAAIRTELNSLGADVTELDDGLLIRPASSRNELRGGLWHAYADHRMAQAGAVIGSVIPGVQIDDIASTSKTMDDFPGLWAGLIGPVVRQESPVG